MCFGRFDCFLCSADTEENERNCNHTYRNSCKNKSSGCICVVIAIFCNQWKEDCCRNRTCQRRDSDSITCKGCTLTGIRSNNTIQCTEWNIPRCCCNNCQEVETTSPCSTCGYAPIRMCPEKHNYQRNIYNRSSQHPRTISSHLCIGIVCQGTNQWIIDCIPASAHKEQNRNCCCRNHCNISHIKRKICAYQHPRYIVNDFT